MSKKSGALIAMALAVMGTVQLWATETECLDYRILPAKKVVIDGKINDWDLSGSIFICSDVETYREQFASWQSAMYDQDNLYLLSRWIDTTPMNNPGIAGNSQGWNGDCLQVRIIANGRTTHVTAWSGRKGQNLINLTYGRDFKGGKVKNAKSIGAQQAFHKNPDGKGYVQEIAIPWKLLTKDGKAPAIGKKIVMTYEPNFGTSSKMRISTKDLFRPGVTPDRVFAFMSSRCWGMATIEKAGGIQPLPVRLADGREFTVTMEKGIPVINWKGLYKEDKTEGFAKINLSMPEDGVVSLIVKNTQGQVVRNLVNAKFITKGEHEILWDGLTTPSHRRPGNPVAVGNYTWEAIYHKGINLTLVGWACNAGRSPYDSPGGNWGGDHGSPCSVASDSNGVYLGWSCAEAGKSVVCTDFKGNVRWRHKRGGFGGAALMAVDKGIVYVYDAGQGNTIYRLNAKNGEYVNWQGKKEATMSLTPFLKKLGDSTRASGMAAVDGKLFLSFGSVAGKKKQASGNTILVLDGTGGAVLRELKAEDPRDLKVGKDGRLYLILGSKTVARLNSRTGAITNVIKNLKNARAVAADTAVNIYVGLNDPDNQVKVFDMNGKALRTVGKRGGRPLLGPWDPSGMRFISGLSVDVKGKLWCVEYDDKPRRVSVWNTSTGAFVDEFFGPTEYGALGGAINPADPYIMAGSGCEWKLNKETGRAKCTGVLHLGRMGNTRFGQSPNGNVYVAVSNWGLGDKIRKIFIYQRVGEGNYKLRTTLKADVEQHKQGRRAREVLVGARIWSDRNDDQKEQKNEIRTQKLDMKSWPNGWYMAMNQAMSFSGGQYRIDVTGWTACGAPEYDLSKAKRLPVPNDLERRGGMSANCGAVSADNNYVIYNGHYGKDHSDFVLYDIRSGKKLLSYPNNYVGVHGGHKAPLATRGMIRGAYDIVGTVKQPAPLDNLFVIGTDKGEWHLLSTSGHYVSSLFEGNPMKIRWPAQVIPGANLNSTPPGMGGEDFGGSVTLANDGKMYVQAGKTAFINCQVNGLETVKALGKGKLKISAADIALAKQFRVKYLSVGSEKKSVTVTRKTIVFTGNPAKDFGVKGLSYGQAPNTVETYLAYDSKNLYAAWQVKDKNPWINGATGFENMYACGDTVDLQLGTNRTKGAMRLSIGRLGGKDTAVIYRRSSSEKAPKTFYSGTVKGGYRMDLVKKLPSVKIKTKIDSKKGYLVQATIPLDAIGLAPTAGMKIRGDVGLTYSDPGGDDTNMRLYWSNKATGLVADEVVELRMQPNRWGEFIFGK